MVENFRNQAVNDLLKNIDRENIYYEVDMMVVFTYLKDICGAGLLLYYICSYENNNQ